MGFFATWVVGSIAMAATIFLVPGITAVGVSTKSNYRSLMDHLGSGKPWDLSRKRDGLTILPPFDLAGNGGVAEFDDAKLVKVVPLDLTCRTQQVHDGCFPNFESTPERAVTLTVPTLARAARQICAVPGKLKAAAVRKTLLDPVSTACPATILRTVPNATLYLDEDSFSLCNDREWDWQ